MEESPMSRISIDVTPQEHQKLKALAALQGKSIKEFVLASTLGAISGAAVEQDLAELEAVLDLRIGEAKSSTGDTRNVENIFQQARDETHRDPDA